MLAEREISSFAPALCAATFVWLYAAVMVVVLKVPVAVAMVVGPYGLNVSFREVQSNEPWSFRDAEIETSVFTPPVTFGAAVEFFAYLISTVFSVDVAVPITAGPYGMYVVLRSV